MHPWKDREKKPMAIRSRLAGALLLIIILSAGMSAGYAADPIPREPTMTLKLSSTAFSHNGEIPKRYTCDDADLSPPLSWSDLPAGTQSLALIVDDPDAPDPAAPQMTWVHWVLYNIPPTATGLAEGIKSKDLPAGTREGINDWKRTGYGGPCPPKGRHRYFHKLYALDGLLPDLGKATKMKLEEAMKGHILGQAELIGTYQRR
jgi:Raf kinase inhibitor-like YbhB/YbcL family protein